MPWSRVSEFEGFEEAHFVVRFRSWDWGGWVPSDGKERETDKNKKKEKQGMVETKTRITSAKRFHVLILLLAYPH